MCEADREECRDLVPPVPPPPRERAQAWRRLGWNTMDVTSLQPLRDAVGEQFRGMWTQLREGKDEL